MKKKLNSEIFIQKSIKSLKNPPNNLQSATSTVKKSDNLGAFFDIKLELTDHVSFDSQLNDLPFSS